MGLDFEPEPDVVLKARYPKAIQNTFDIKEVNLGITRPGKFRKHVFDFTDGFRLIISRDTDGKDTFLHFSASVIDVTMLDMPEFMALAVEHIKRLSDEDFSGVILAESTEEGVLHLMWDESQKIQKGRKTSDPVNKFPMANPKWN